MDLTRGNLLNVHCLDLMKSAPTGSAWFTPPPIFTKQANTPWVDKKNPGDPSYDEALGKKVLDRILAVILGRTYFVVDQGICDASDMNWLTRLALGFGQGLLDLADKLGARRVKEICTAYAAANPGFVVPKSILEEKLAVFRRNVTVQRDGDVAVVTIRRPEVKNALNDLTMHELKSAVDEIAADAGVKGIVLTGFAGGLAGADIMELAALATGEAAEQKCLRGHAILEAIASSKKPIVAALSGPVMGGGAELSMACHARVVAPDLMLAQPEVNLGIIPGYGGTQRLPRLVGIERGVDMLRTGRVVGAKEACAWGWATGQPAADVVGAAKALLRDAFAGKAKLAPVNPEPMQVPAKLAAADIGHRSLAIDAILVDVVRRGLAKPLAEGLAIEAHGFGQCKKTIDMDIGMKNFIQNGPRVPAAFLHE
jgi:enoyl-CoA hydratase/carnithine racemase